MTRALTPQERAIEAALAEKVGTVEQVPSPNDWTAVVTVNGVQQPVGLAKLMVMNEQAVSLERIAAVLERLEAVLGSGKPPTLKAVT